MGRRIIRIFPKKQFFVIRQQNEDGLSPRFRVYNEDEWGQFKKNHLMLRMADIDG